MSFHQAAVQELMNVLVKYEVDFIFDFPRCPGGVITTPIMAEESLAHLFVLAAHFLLCDIAVIGPRCPGGVHTTPIMAKERQFCPFATFALEDLVFLSCCSCISSISGLLSSSGVRRCFCFSADWYVLCATLGPFVQSRTRQKSFPTRLVTDLMCCARTEWRIGLRQQA